MTEIVTIPCLTDNYAFLLHDPSSGATAAIDVPDSAPIEAALQERGWQLSSIWITHHHPDHIGGVETLKAATGAQVIGAAVDSHRLPKLDVAVAEGDTIALGNLKAEIIDVSGHTVGHVAFYVPDALAVFTGDSLMALGCGRLFEGRPAHMWASLGKLASLPGDLQVCSGHEYTAANARFALTIEPENADLQARSAEIDAARAAGQATVPSSLETERATNPFLRAHLPEVKTAIGMESAPDIDVFAEIRRRKDNF